MNSLKCTKSKSLSHCLTELLPLYHNKHWTIIQWDDRSVYPSSHRIISKIFGFQESVCSFWNKNFFKAKLRKLWNARKPTEQWLSANFLLALLFFRNWNKLKTVQLSVQKKITHFYFSKSISGPVFEKVYYAY